MRSASPVKISWFIKDDIKWLIFCLKSASDLTYDFFMTTLTRKLFFFKLSDKNLCTKFDAFSR